MIPWLRIYLIQGLRQRDPDKEVFWGADALNSTWTKIANKLPDANQIQDIDLKNIKNDSNNSVEKLRVWCFSKYKFTYKSWFHEKNDSLLKDVKGACVLTIKNSLDNSLEAENDSDQEEFKKNLETLKKHPKNNQDLLLDKTLRNLKHSANKTPNPEKDWKDLRDWCKSAFEKGFQGKGGKRWKLANKFCTKEKP